MSRLEQKQRLSSLLLDFVKRENISVTKLARRLGVAQPSAQAYVDGVTYPTEDVRKRIAKTLELTFEELQAHLDDVPVNRKLTTDDLSREIRALPLSEFVKIVPVVFERVESELKTQSSLSI